MRMWEELKETDGEGNEYINIVKHKSEARGGLTQKPICDEDALCFISLLHAMLRGFDMILKLI